MSYPYYYIPGIGSFKKEGGSGGRIRTHNLSIISLDLYRLTICFLE